LPEKEVESDIIRAAGGLVWVLDEGEKKIVIVHRISARACWLRLADLPHKTQTLSRQPPLEN
jgi:hypothetical protein